MKVIYQCKQCGKPFQAEQGSKRRYCNKCILKRVSQGRPPKPTLPQKG